jgi:glycosyltransferase involved in cell wall biosynthesis
MKFSVIIPAYNAAKTIGATLDAVLAQTVMPHEILVFDDGSTDNTTVILQSYKPHITVFRQSNQGVAHARNFLCAQARGEILAFLDADDLWHPRYLEAQSKFIHDYPGAVAYFTEHENLTGYDNYQWQNSSVDLAGTPQLISAGDFIIRYDRTPLSFQMSCFCLRKGVLSELGEEPFPVRISGADDTYMHNMLPLLGPVLHTSARLVAYRIMASSISANQLRMALSVVDVFEMLKGRYRDAASKNLYQTFKTVFASRRRNCGKYLMGSGRIMDARKQFLLAIRESMSPISIAKSLGQYCLSYLPRALQPRWPAGQRILSAEHFKNRG